MYELDLISDYFPTLEDLTPAELNSARVKVAVYISRHHPDLDIRPGSVAGDLMIEPMSLWLAGTTTAMSRFMSDLDLENISNNIIYNCDFVERYIGNFAVYDRDALSATGVVRLTFSKDTLVTIDRGIRYTFTSNTEYYYIRMPQPTGDLEIIPSGQTPTPGSNQFRLTQNGLDSWFVDLPVYGNLITDVAAGTTGQTDRVLPNQVGEIVAVTNFTGGSVTNTLSQLAKKARTTAYSSSVNTRHGTEHMVQREWPDTNIVSTVLSGDSEMQRDKAGNPMMLPSPAIDIYYRSKGDNAQQQQTISLKWDPVTESFRGEVKLGSNPSRILSTQAANDEDLELPQVTYYTQAQNNLPGLTSAGSRKELLWVSIVAPKDASGNVLIPRVTVGDDTVGLFTVTYLADPLLQSVATELEAYDSRAVGVSTLVKGGPIVILDSINIAYWRDPGVSLTLDSARVSIASYINGVGWPECFTEKPITAVVQYSGAKRVKNITYNATLRFSVADRLLHNGVIFDSTLTSELENNSKLIPTKTINLDGSDMIPNVVENNTLHVATGTTDTHSATYRNVRYHIDPANIVFNEV